MPRNANVIVDPARALLALAVACVALTAHGAILSRLNQGESLTISAIGTSETAISPWFSQMGVWLNSEYHGKVTLDNEALSGTNSTSGIDVQLPAALTHNPDAVFIEFSMNDCGQDAVTHTNWITLEQSKANLQTMIDTIRDWAADNDKTVDIVVQTMNNDPWSTFRPDLAAYYQGYREVAEDNGLLLIDHYPNWMKVFDSEPGHDTWISYVPDHIHPDVLGVKNVILPDIQKALSSQIPEPSIIVLLVMALICLICYAWSKGEVVDVLTK